MSRNSAALAPGPASSSDQLDLILPFAKSISSVINSTSGDADGGSISLTGDADGSGSSNYGVQIDGSGTQVTSVNGNISVTGDSTTKAMPGASSSGMAVAYTT